MHISGILVHTKPGHTARARDQLNGVAGVEIHIGDEDGKLIVTLEQQDEETTVAAFEQINRLPDILSATMVYHHFEPETDFNELVNEETENGVISSRICQT